MTTRIPIGTNLESRDGTLTKDAHSTNCLIENAAKPKLRKRPGCTDFGAVNTGIAQLLTYWNGIKTIIGDYFSSISGSGGVSHITTWNPADKDAGVTLSGGNLVADSVNPNVGSVRSVVSVSSGTWFFEITVTAAVATPFIGMANASANMALFCGSDNNAIGYESGSIIKNGFILASVATFTTGDVIGVLYNATLNTITWYKNGNFVYTATGTNVPVGAVYACVGWSFFSGTLTANFGGSAYTFPVNGVVSTNLSPTSASLPFSAQSNGSNAGTNYLMFKNATQAWTLTPSGTPTLITDIDYPGISTVTITQLVSSGTVATAQTPANTNFQVGSAVVIAGAAPAGFNGTQTITGVTASSVVPAVSIPISITRNGTTATATSTTQAHGFINGQVVPIQGANQNEYNGPKTITWISATQFSFTVTVTGTDASATAGGSPIINPYTLQFSGTNTAGATTTFLCSYQRPEDFGSLVNGQTFTVNALAMGVCTVSAASTGTFTLTSTGFGGASPGTFGGLSGQPTSPTISTLTQSNGLATLTTSAAHNYSSGKQITISGATSTPYNGLTTIQVTGATTFTYILPGVNATPASPATGTIIAGSPAVITGASFTYATTVGATTATGTITATGGRNTVPGISYLNGPFFVMDGQGVIYNSGSDDPTTWDALDFIPAQGIPGNGVALGRSLNYIIAFKEWSTEPFYDAKQPTGSPLLPYESGLTTIGCASGTSVADVNGTIMWIAQTKERGRSVYLMVGIQQKQVSTPDIERILNADDLVTVYAYGLKISGHALYILTLGTSNLTLVYDLTSDRWYNWTSYTIAEQKAVTSITLASTTATVTCAAHGIADGEPVTISGATPAGYNGLWQTQYVDANTFTIQVAAGLTTPATGTIFAFPYTESAFVFTKYADCAGVDLMLHKSNGHLYNLLPTVAQDAGIPINYFARSQKLDGNTTKSKTMGRIVLVGNTVADTAMLRWSDDDYQTFSPYRVLNINEERQMIRRCGAFRHRSIDMKHIGNTQPIWEELEMEIR